MGVLLGRVQPVFRFAPSPNGELHLGHAYSALLNQRLAREANGLLLLRIEDIDRARCTAEFARRIEVDLAFLGLEWPLPPRRQSEHFDRYEAALASLRAQKLIYPGFMSRGDVRNFAADFERDNGRPWPIDPDGAPLYPGLDRALSGRERSRRIAAGEAFAWRLDMPLAVAKVGTLGFSEAGGNAVEDVLAEPSRWGDVVLARRDVSTSYHLAVTVDDALQGVTDVVRGRDLYAATSVHRLLQALLGLPTPRYRHHDLVLGPDGRKLSKSNRDTSLRNLREAGRSAADIRGMVGF